MGVQLGIRVTGPKSGPALGVVADDLTCPFPHLQKADVTDHTRSL